MVTISMDSKQTEKMALQIQQTLNEKFQKTIIDKLDRYFQ